MVDGANALEHIRNFAASWAKAKPPTRATMIQLVYEEVIVRGEQSGSRRRAMLTASRSPCPRRS
jgi:hypothetical protein